MEIRDEDVRNKFAIKMKMKEVKKIKENSVKMSLKIKFFLNFNGFHEFKKFRKNFSQQLSNF